MESCSTATIEDFEDVFNIYEAVKAKGKVDGSSDWDEYYPREEHLQEDLKLHWVRVLKVEDRIVASLSIIKEKDQEIESLPWIETESCFLTRLCVSPDWQGQGIAEKMMRDAMSFAIEHGFRATHHLAAVVNERANRVYVRMGYECRGRYRLFDTWYYAYEMILARRGS